MRIRDPPRLNLDTLINSNFSKSQNMNYMCLVSEANKKIIKLDEKGTFGIVCQTTLILLTRFGLI